MQTCETCAFWRPFGDKELGRGECRRHAPSPRVVFPGREADKAGIEDGDDHPAVWWPDTFSDDFCGEWKSGA